MMVVMHCPLIFGDKGHNRQFTDGLGKSVEIELDHSASLVGRSIC